MNTTIEEKIKALGFALPVAPKPAANYVPFLQDGHSLFISGQISLAPDGHLTEGKVGENLSVEDGQMAAKYCALNILAQAKAALDDLDRIEKLIKLGGFVSASAQFSDHPLVINGASDFMVAVLGEEIGSHTRFAVGAVSLPLNAAVEIEALFRIKA